MVSLDIAELCVDKDAAIASQKVTQVMRTPKLVDHRDARIGPHARCTDQVRIAGFLHRFLCSRCARHSFRRRLQNAGCMERARPQRDRIRLPHLICLGPQRQRRKVRQRCGLLLEPPCDRNPRKNNLLTRETLDETTRQGGHRDRLSHRHW